jgi:hypothetical protein
MSHLSLIIIFTIRLFHLRGKYHSFITPVLFWVFKYPFVIILHYFITPVSDRRATGAVNALDCVDGRGIAGATTTEDPATTMSKQSVGLRGRGGDDDDDFDPRGNGDNDTTISLAMATATRVAGDKEGDGGKSNGDDTPTSLATATATRSGGRRRVR